MFLYILLFLFFAVAVIFGVLFVLKKTSVKNLKDDMTSLLSSIKVAQKNIMTPTEASCLTSKISTSLDDDPVKMGVVFGDLCAFATATSVSNLKDAKIPAVCSKYNGGINKTSIPQMITACKGS